LKKLSISIKIGVIKRYGVWSVSKIVDRIRRQSSWASPSVSSRRRRRCVLGIILLSMPQNAETRQRGTA